MKFKIVSIYTNIRLKDVLCSFSDCDKFKFKYLIKLSEKDENKLKDIIIDDARCLLSINHDDIFGKMARLKMRKHDFMIKGLV